MGLAVLDGLTEGPGMAAYQPYWAARAELLARLDRRTDADVAYGHALALECDPAARLFLAARRAAVARG